MFHILRNARRLKADATTLREAGSYHSATVLMIQAIEELGKFFIESWKVKNKANRRQYPTHVEKQSAVFCLLAANEALKYRRRVERLRNAGELNFHKVGEMSSQLAWARAGFYEDLRMSALYADENPKIPPEITENIDENLVKELASTFDKAIRTTSNRRAIELAAEIFSNDLGRL